MTNREKINSMSNEEFANFLFFNSRNNICKMYDFDCVEGVKCWLEREYDDKAESLATEEKEPLPTVCCEGVKYWLEYECECCGMTNREKLNAMSNEELADFLFFNSREKICKMCDFDCVQDGYVE